MPGRRLSACERTELQLLMRRYQDTTCPEESAMLRTSIERLTREEFFMPGDVRRDRLAAALAGFEGSTKKLRAMPR